MYSPFERRVGQLLDSFPRIRAISKFAYQRIAYFVSGNRSCPLVLRSDVTISDVLDLAPKSRGYDHIGSMFFGYFGTSPWSRCGRYFLVHNLPSSKSQTGEAQVLVLDLHAGTRTVLAQTKTWNYQQGSMAQWLGNGNPGTAAFNDVAGSILGCRLVSLEGKERFIPWPIQAIHPAGKDALSLNYRRLWRVRPEYGYRVPVENLKPDQPFGSDGIWRVSLDTGESDLLFSFDNLIQFRPRSEMSDAEHKVNHAVYSPDGQHFVFVHRWLGSKGKFSRLFHAQSDGSNLRLLLDNRMISHYTWKDERTLLTFARTAKDGDRYYVIDVVSGECRVLGGDSLDRFGDGHPSYSPDRRWIVTDTYPDKARMRRLLLFRCADGHLLEIGAFFTPWSFDGASRCDLHPRWSPDGQFISVDSVHDGSRRSYIIDVSRIVNCC